MMNVEESFIFQTEQSTLTFKREREIFFFISSSHSSFIISNSNQLQRKSDVMPEQNTCYYNNKGVLYLLKL